MVSYQMRFSDSFLDEVRDRVPISSVIGRRVTWDRKKTNASRGDYWACCPFHGENTPSFHCEDRKGRYHCFGCGVSGDHFRFLTELDGLSFPEAVERIADMAGVPMPARDPEAEHREKKRASLTEVMELAAAFFQEQLQSAAGAAARAYLRNRGLTSATLERFRIGYAPNSRNALKSYLAGKGVGKDQIEACGLVVHGDDIAVSYDRFRDRIMFPIEDARERVIAFGGRAMSPDARAKYLNSPETELFQKGRILYNYARARTAAQSAGTIVAVEGYMDVIAAAQAGIENIVAPLGTALTVEQLSLLWRASDDPILAFDGDAAGARAAGRVLDLTFANLQLGKSLRFAMLPEGKDPDDLIRDGGVESFKVVLKNASPLRDFFVLRRRAEMGVDTPEQKAAFEKRLYDDIEPIKDSILKKYYRSHLRLRILEVISGRTLEYNEGNVARLTKAIDDNKLVATILGFCVEYPELIPDYIERMIIDENRIDNKVYRVFATELYRLYVELGHLNVSDVYEKLDKSFFAVLNAVHGREWMKPIRNSRNDVVGERFVERGHRLRFLFPMIRYNPPMELVRHAMDFFFRKIEYSVVEKEYRESSYDFSEQQFYAHQEEIIRRRDELVLMEQELDESFQLWVGRSAYGFAA